MFKPLSRYCKRSFYNRLLSRFLMYVCLGICYVWTLTAPDYADASHYFFPRVQARIEQLVMEEAHRQGYACNGEPICGLQLIPVFYKERGYEPVWFDRDGLRPSVRALLRAIRKVDQDGLRPSDYHLSAIIRVLDRLDDGVFPPDESKAAQWADLDLILTDAFLLLGSHLSGGRINPETLHADWLVSERSIDLIGVLHKAATHTQIGHAVDQLRPVHSGYMAMQEALRRLRQLEIQGGWPQIQSSRTISPGDEGIQVLKIRRHMVISEDLSDQKVPNMPEMYDEVLKTAVKRFQKRHGLKPDGLIGPKTLGAMNVTVKQRIRQIEINLERWRWLPRDLGYRHIMVNTADFNLRVVENKQNVLEMRVVVGRPARRTPVFSARVDYMVLNPYWNVPHTIAVEDILPKLADGVDYLINQSFKVFRGWSEGAEEIDPSSIEWGDYSKSNFPFRLRQEPGTHNALGQIKFMFPNKFAVYLHDTPQRSLFNHFQRDFSSGCIRVEDAPALAAYMLSGDPVWTPEKLRENLMEGQPKVVHISKSIPIHLLYMTAWVDEDDTMQFRNDIYDRDQDLDTALMQHRPEQLPPLADAHAPGAGQ